MAELVFEVVNLNCPVRHDKVSLTLQTDSFSAAGFVSGSPISCSSEGYCKKCSNCLLRFVPISTQRLKLKGVS